MWVWITLVAAFVLLAALIAFLVRRSKTPVRWWVDPENGSDQASGNLPADDPLDLNVALAPDATFSFLGKQR